MQKSLIISIALHFGVLLWAVASFPSAQAYRVPQTPSIPVEIVTSAQVSKVKAGQRKAKSDKPHSKKRSEKSAAKVKKRKSAKRPAKSARAVPPKRSKPKVKPAPKPKKAKKPKPSKPKTASKKKPAVKQPPKKKTVVEKPAKPKPKRVAAKTSKKDFDTDRIAALLNKIPDAGSDAAPARPDATKPVRQSRGHEAGRDEMLSMNEIDALRARISQCWSPPVGGMGADAVKVRLRLQLGQDGSLSRAPQVMNREASPFFQAAADSAVRAVLQCQPYQLPAAKYAAWRDMVLNFDPREMFGG
ncbi:MAG: hypothetical protein MI824_26730 [Hyphomicrobiales bacterium]|nr:hypothetical protein [Hyphomicrobiales bacterium]